MAMRRDRDSAGSASHDLRHLPEVTIGRAENQGKLNRQGCDPQVIRRYGRSLVAELQIELRIVVRRLFVRQQDGNAGTVQEPMKVGVIRRFVRRIIAPGKAG